MQEVVLTVLEVVLTVLEDVLTVLEVVLTVLEVVQTVLEVVQTVLEAALHMLEVVNGMRCVLWVPEVMLCMLFCSLLCILEAVEGGLRLLGR